MLYGAHVVVLQLLSSFQHFLTPWTPTCQASLSITSSRSLLKLMSIESVIPSYRLILCRPFSSHLQSFPASGSFPMSRFFTSGGQSIGVSASTSVLPMNIQSWFPLVKWSIDWNLESVRWRQMWEDHTSYRGEQVWRFRGKGKNGTHVWETKSSSSCVGQRGWWERNLEIYLWDKSVRGKPSKGWSTMK